MRFDVEYGPEGAKVVPHFCRDWDEEGGCYGTREDHGFSLEEAATMCAEWHEEQALLYRLGTHYDLQYYGGQNVDSSSDQP